MQHAPDGHILKGEAPDTCGAAALFGGRQSCALVQHSNACCCGKWVFRVKNNKRHRAQLCAIGYTQVAGVDFQDNFVLVVNNVTFRIEIVLMIAYGWDADIVDIKTAFLYRNINKEIL